MKSVIDMFKENNNKPSVGDIIQQGSNIVMIENLPLDELYVIINQLKIHMRFLKWNNMLSHRIKEDMMVKIDYI